VRADCQAWKLPPSRFDPLGPGSFPIAICLILILLSGLALGVSLIGKSLGAAETSMILGVGEDGSGRRRPLLAVVVFALAAAYAAALHWTPLGFFWATSAFVFAAGYTMSRGGAKTAARALAVALGVSGALTFVFGGLLGFPLP
jgi:hypothetical protein